MAVKAEAIDMVKLLLAMGADTRAYDAEGLTALHWAVKEHRPSIVSLFAFVRV